MKILINSENVDFSLEENLSLSAIVDEVADWAQSQNLYILDYRFSLQEGRHTERPCRDDLAQVEFLIGDHRELILTHLNELQEFIDRAGMFLAEKARNEQDLSAQEEQQYREAVEFLRESITTLEKQTGGISEEFEAALISLESSAGIFEKLQALALIRNKVSLWVRQLRLDSLTEEDKNNLRRDFAQKITPLADQLEKIAGDFTAGKEAAALNALEPVVELLSDGLAVLLSAEKVPEAAEKLVALLSELTAALDAADLVTAADLIDFDLRECLAELASQINL